jgi:hypothetical protein
MRKSVRVSAPLTVITGFYALLVAVSWGLLALFPDLHPYLPVGGVAEMLEGGPEEFEIVRSIGGSVEEQVYVLKLAIATLGGMLLMAPVSWMYFITTPIRKVDRSFAQTMMILPVIVAGIAMIVQDSLALAFSLAGVVAAVRFRFSLSEPAHTLYIFCAIAIGLGAGVSALGIATVISMGFVYGTLVLWILDYGARLNSPFFSFLTSRDHQDDDL